MPSSSSFSILSSLSSLSLISPNLSRTPRPTTIRLLPPIRMGGGPRTFPGGVSKWQWKRMQAKKSKQLLKARLLRERQIYEMRKRAELKAAVSELERPWEVVEQAPVLFSVAADEQVKALADRFQRPGGFDMWSERDGPQILRRRSDGELMASERVFPKGAVHSLRPYGVVHNSVEEGGRRRRRRRRRDYGNGAVENGDERRNGDLGVIDVEGRWMKEGNGNYLGLENSERDEDDGVKDGRQGARWNANFNANEGRRSDDERRGGRWNATGERQGVGGNASQGRGRGRGSGGHWNRGDRVRGSESMQGNNGGQWNTRERVDGTGHRGSSSVQGNNGERMRGSGSVQGNNGERIRLRPSTELSYNGGRSRVRVKES